MAIESKYTSGNILITAFGPFPGVPINPSSVLLNKYLSLKKDHIIGDFIETSFDYCEKWLKETNFNKISLVIHLGVATGSNKFRLEKYGKNQCSPYSFDVNGMTWNSNYVYQGEKSIISTEIDIEKIIFQLKRKNLPIEISEDAGSYLCNFLYYNTLLKKHKENLSTKVLFIHIPDDDLVPLRFQIKIFSTILNAIIVPWYNETNPDFLT